MARCGNSSCANAASRRAPGIARRPATSSNAPDSAPVDSPVDYYRLKIICSCGGFEGPANGRALNCAPAAREPPSMRPLMEGKSVTILMRIVSVLIATRFAATAAQAEIKVGFITSLSGPSASIGIPYSKGIAAAVEYANSVNGEKIKLISLDDGSDPSAATRNARKLVEEEKVDILIGTASTPSTNAMAAVANELKVPMIGVSPIQAPNVPADDL